MSLLIDQSALLVFRVLLDPDSIVEILSFHREPTAPTKNNASASHFILF